MAKKIKCDYDPEDYIGVEWYTEGHPGSVDVVIIYQGQYSAVEFNSPKKVQKLIKQLQKASAKAWGLEGAYGPDFQ